MGTQCAFQGRISIMVWYRSGGVICAGRILRARDSLEFSHRCSAWCALGRTEIRLLRHCSLHGVEEHLRAIFRVMMCARGITWARADLFTPTLISTGYQWR